MSGARGSRPERVLGIVEAVLAGSTAPALGTTLLQAREEEARAAAEAERLRQRDERRRYRRAARAAQSTAPQVPSLPPERPARSVPAEVLVVQPKANRPHGGLLPFDGDCLRPAGWELGRPSLDGGSAAADPW